MEPLGGSEVLWRQTAVSGLGEKAKPAKVGTGTDEMKNVEPANVAPQLVDLGFERNVGCRHAVRSLMENARKAVSNLCPVAVGCGMMPGTDDGFL